MWDPTPVCALSHGFGLDGNDPLPRHVFGSIILGLADLVLCSGTITLIWGGSDDIKLGVVRGYCVNLMTSYLCFWDWTWNVHHGICF